MKSSFAFYPARSSWRTRTRALRYRGSGPTRSGDSEPPPRERPPDPTLNPACPRTTTCGSYLARNPARVAPLRVGVPCARRGHLPVGVRCPPPPHACPHKPRGRTRTRALRYRGSGSTRSGDSEPPPTKRPPDPTLNPACPRTTTCGSYLARNPARVAPLRVGVPCAHLPRVPPRTSARSRSMSPPPRTVVLRLKEPFDRAQIKIRDEIEDEIRQVTPRQPLARRRR